MYGTVLPSVDTTVGTLKHEHPPSGHLTTLTLQTSFHLESAGRVGAVAVLGWQLLEQPQPEERLGVHGLPRRLVLLDRLDVARAVLSGDVHGDDGAVGMHRVRRGQLPGRWRVDGMQELHAGQLLPARRVGGAAVPRRDLLEQHGARICIRVHRVPRRLVLRDWVDDEHAVLPWDVHGRHRPIRMHPVRGWHLLRSYQCH